MAMGQQKDRQGDLMVGWAEMPRSPGHVFYDRLQSVLIEGGFDAFAEASCRAILSYAAQDGRALGAASGAISACTWWATSRASTQSAVCEWRCSDSLSLREFLRLGSSCSDLPDHSWLSKTRARLPHEVHAAVFDWVLSLDRRGAVSVKGEQHRGGCLDHGGQRGDCATSCGATRVKATGRCWSILEPGRAASRHPRLRTWRVLDRKRKGKKLSNQDWVSRSDPEAKIAKMKDGTTHLVLQARARGGSGHRRWSSGGGACGSHKSYLPQEILVFPACAEDQRLSTCRTTIRIVLAMVREAFLSRAALHLENLALRQQLAALDRKGARPSLRMADRPFLGTS